MAPSPSFIVSLPALPFVHMALFHGEVKERTVYIPCAVERDRALERDRAANLQQFTQVITTVSP